VAVEDRPDTKPTAPAPRPWEQDPHQRDRQLPSRARKPGHDDVDEQRGRGDAERDDDQHRAPSSPATAPASRRASSVLPAAMSRVYSGSATRQQPSPNRFCRKLGIRNAAKNASAASVDWPKK